MNNSGQDSIQVIVQNVRYKNIFYSTFKIGYTKDDKREVV